MLARFQGKVIGCIVVGEEDHTASFNMLAVSPKMQGKRFGVALVKAAENWARAQGHKTMQLELLLPVGWTHKFQEFLK